MIERHGCPPVARISTLESSTAAARFARPRFVNADRAAIQFHAVSNIHGFLPLARLHEMGWFFRGVFVAMLFCGITCATYFITLEAKNFNKDIVDIINDYEQLIITIININYFINYLRRTILQVLN